MKHEDADKVPLQVTYRPDGTIDTGIAQEAYKEYVAQFGNSQSFQRLHERGGFGETELIKLLYCRIRRLENKPVKL